MIRLLSDLILIRPVAKPELQIGSILLPDQRDDARGFSKHQDGAICFGEVVATGPGEKMVIYACDSCGAQKSLRVGPGLGGGIGKCPQCKTDTMELQAEGRMPMCVKVGDRLVFPHRAGTRYDVEGREHYIFHETQFAYGIVDG